MIRETQVQRGAVTMGNGTYLRHPSDGRVYACRYCDGTRVRLRNPEKAVNDPEHVHYCEDCKTGFSQPVERDKKESNGGGKSATHGLASKLEDMNADEVGA